MTATEVSRTAARVQFRECHVSRYRSFWPQFLGYHRPNARTLVIGAQTRIETGGGAVAGENIVIGGTVIRVVMPERPDEGELVHLSCHFRQQFADGKPGDFCFDRV